MIETPKLADWIILLRRFKERIAERLWALPTVSEAEKEIVFKEYLADLDDLERSLSRFQEDAAARARAAHEENDLLRSLMGVPGEELKTRALTMAQELSDTKERLERREEELQELRRRLNESQDENAALRARVNEFEEQSDVFRAQQLKLREDDVRYFSETHESLRNQVKDLEHRLGNLRALFADSNKKLLTDKQEEISLLQSRLLDEMEQALRRKQELAWAEEEAFAKGVAHRVRTALVSAQGQLMLTLERLGLMDPETQTEAFWKPRLKLFVEGAGELARNFREIQALMQEVTGALDDYLHLTHRRDITREPVSLSDLVRSEIASLYGDRRPTLHIELLSDDPLPHVPGDRSLLSFVVRELLKNAVEALPDGAGQIVISLKHVPERGLLHMMVRDSGSGIPDHLRPRLFQPFFTTKEHRQGLNLSRAKPYVEFHNGTLELIDSGPDGTLFQVELPTADAQPPFIPMSMKKPEPGAA